MYSTDTHILIVDDDALMLDFLSTALSRRGFRVDKADNGIVALEKIRANQYHLVLTDMRMPSVSGIEILEAVKESWPSTDVVIITGYGTIENAVEAMEKGAYNYITKPCSAAAIEHVVDRALEHQNLMAENRYLQSELMQRYGLDSVIGRSPVMKQVFETVEVISSSAATILIMGETGTGKEVIARAIHYNSPRRNRPFIKVNCAALPADLVESELFGHEKGAYTGAFRQTKGKFEVAHKGTLLFDEIGEISPSLQPKLLRVLQEMEFERVGGEGQTIKVDVRIIATTNKDLEEEVEKGRFREDLFYRLNVVPICLPPLRERKKEDIPLLAKFFLEKYNQKNGRQIEGFSEEALNILMNHDWPGNVRELENALERAVIMCQENILQPEHFGLRMKSFEPAGGNRLSVGTSLRELERELILKTLRAQDGHKEKTARILGISVRTLRNKLNAYRSSGEVRDEAVLAEIPDG